MTVPTVLFLYGLYLSMGCMDRKILHSNLSALHAGKGAFQSPGSNLIQALSGTPSPRAFLMSTKQCISNSIPHCMV